MKKVLFSLLALIAGLPMALSAKSFDDTVNDFFQPITDFLNTVIFVSFSFTLNGEVINLPIVLVILIGGALYFTFYFKFVNFRKFGLSLDIVRGKYTDPNDSGEVSHFQALTAALSGTVGLGNIAGVAIAISIGGPGATFWMIMAGLIGMSSKFVECTLGVKYREVAEDGTVFGGPMYYLSKGFAGLQMIIGGKPVNYASMGKFLATIFAIACIGGSFGGGNMFQVNQAYQQLNNITASTIASDQLGSDLVGSKVFNVDSLGFPFEVKSVNGDQVVLATIPTQAAPTTVESTVPATTFTESFRTKPLDNFGWLIGIIFAVLVGIVIIGGIKSIAKVTDKIVPFMVGVYILAALVVLGANFAEIPSAFGQIFEGAFTGAGIGGGLVGVLIQGFRRAAFSNEAGIGSASIAHSAVKTSNPVSEGLVALLEPFIDTVLVCTMTALVIVVTGMHEVTGTGDGIALTSDAFESVIGWFPYMLVVAVVLFAFSTMVTWSYYGMQAWSYLFGKSRSVQVSYKVIFCLMVIVGAASQLDAVIGFSDAMIFAMLFPNMIGLVFLAPVVRNELNVYLEKIRTGAIIKVK